MKIIEDKAVHQYWEQQKDIAKREMSICPECGEKEKFDLHDMLYLKKYNGLEKHSYGHIYGSAFYSPFFSLWKKYVYDNCTCHTCGCKFQNSSYPYDYYTAKKDYKKMLKGENNEDER